MKVYQDNNKIDNEIFVFYYFRRNCQITYNYIGIHKLISNNKQVHKYIVKSHYR